jgi:hypothetical protein
VGSTVIGQGANPHRDTQPRLIILREMRLSPIGHRAIDGYDARSTASFPRFQRRPSLREVPLATLANGVHGYYSEEAYLSSALPLPPEHSHLLRCSTRSQRPPTAPIPRNLEGGTVDPGEILCYIRPDIASTSPLPSSLPSWEEDELAKGAAAEDIIYIEVLLSFVRFPSDYTTPKRSENCYKNRTHTRVVPTGWQHLT